MNNTRQDAWSQDEDVLLAETVLRYIREGKTQLEAFKEVANRLSRTPAACGFRWNASIRKQYQQAIQLAKQERKQADHYPVYHAEVKNNGKDAGFEAAISMLEKLRHNYESANKQSVDAEIQRLKTENDQLKERLKRYRDAWNEIGDVWKRAESPEEERQSK
ncbi:RsfA family transcriptional regulator [Sediminibacillus halophilus]|uniref:Transcription factor, RsfA family n=1 Tax=Sediminibacillus halophilus TaxID=482461 RepID=A0A1G9MSS8_9BACI|nr:RsfA family transcriptional regulator [Sediminibacillus halophilus]SDL77269.1 transcription factor, RsfA family [Sediminibacillus halophilus]